MDMSQRDKVSKVLKFAVISEAVKSSPNIREDRGSIQSLAKSFNVSFKLTKKVVEGTANCKSPQDLAERAK